MNNLKWNWIWKPRLDLFTRITLWVTIVVLLCLLGVAIGAKYTFAEEDSYLKMYTDGIYCIKDTNCKDLYDKKVTCYEPDDVAKLSEEDQKKYNKFYPFVEMKNKKGICGYIAYKPNGDYSLNTVTKKIQDSQKVVPLPSVCPFTQDDLEEAKDYYKEQIEDCEALIDEQEQTVKNQEEFIYQCETDRKDLQNENVRISGDLSRTSIELNETRYLISSNPGRGGIISPLGICLILCGIVCLTSLYFNIKQKLKHKKNKNAFAKLKFKLEETEKGITHLRKTAQAKGGK